MRFCVAWLCVLRAKTFDVPVYLLALGSTHTIQLNESSRHVPHWYSGYAKQAGEGRRPTKANKGSHRHVAVRVWCLKRSTKQYFMPLCANHSSLVVLGDLGQKLWHAAIDIACYQHLHHGASRSTPSFLRWVNLRFDVFDVLSSL